MKKKFLIVLSIFIFGLFTACSKSVEGTEVPEEPEENVTVTFDCRTYLGDDKLGCNGDGEEDPEYYDQFYDAECTHPIVGNVFEMTYKKGITLNEMFYYEKYGDDGPIALCPLYITTAWVDEDDEFFLANKPITQDMTLFLRYGFGCVAKGCEITMADGSVKKVEDVKLGDELLTWDFYTGKLVGKKVISIDETESATRPKIVITTNMGTVINIVDVQAFFDTDAKKYFNISNLNYKHQIGRNIMVCHDGETVTSETITSIELHEEIMGLYDLITEDSLNFISDGALTVVPLLFSITPYDVDADYKYNPEKMAADRATYGLTKYDDFKAYCTEDAFNKLRLEEVQILLGKGLISQDYLKYVINKFYKSTEGIR